MDSFSRLFQQAEESQEMPCFLVPMSVAEPTLHSGHSPLKLSQESFAVGVWWSCVFWTPPGAACITHLLDLLGLIPEDLGLVWAFLVLQFGILHQGHHLLWCVPGCWKELLWYQAYVHVLFLFPWNCQANLCAGYDRYLNTVEQGKKKPICSTKRHCKEQALWLNKFTSV